MQRNTHKDINKDKNLQKVVLSESKRTTNMMNEPNIHKLLANGKRVTQESKKAQTCVPNSLCETYSAFAINTYLMLNGT